MRKITPHGWSILFLLTATVVWGLSYAINRYALSRDDLNPIAFAGFRYFFGTIAILPMALRWRRHPAPALYGVLTFGRKYNWLWGGALCGALLAGGSMLQLYGLVFTTAGKAGFITTLYVIMVPVLGFILGQIPRLMVWAALGLGLAGLIVMTGGGGVGGGFGRGDAILIIADFFWAAHVLVMGFFAGRSNPWLFIFSQSLASCLICLAISLFGGLLPSWEVFLEVLPESAWGIMSVGLAYVLQMMGQRDIPPTATAMIMQLQSVVAVLAGAVFLSEDIGKAMLAGAVIMLSGSLLANLAPTPVILNSEHRHYDKVRKARLAVGFLLAAALGFLIVWTVK